MSTESIEKAASSASASASTTATLLVSRQFKKSGALVKEEATEELVEVAVPPPGVPQALVGFNAKMTLNLGNFESISLGISLTIPSYREEINEAYDVAKDFVNTKLNAEISSVREHRESKKGK